MLLTSSTLGLLVVLVLPVAVALWRLWSVRRTIAMGTDPAYRLTRGLDRTVRDLRLAGAVVLPLTLVVTLVMLDSLTGGSAAGAFLTTGVCILMVAGIASALLFAAASAFRRDASGLPILV
jgi:hypothetical protein